MYLIHYMALCSRINPLPCLWKFSTRCVRSVAFLIRAEMKIGTCDMFILVSMQIVNEVLQQWAEPPKRFAPATRKAVHVHHQPVQLGGGCHHHLCSKQGFNLILLRWRLTFERFSLVTCSSFWVGKTVMHWLDRFHQQFSTALVGLRKLLFSVDKNMIVGFPGIELKCSRWARLAVIFWVHQVGTQPNPAKSLHSQDIFEGVCQVTSLCRLPSAAKWMFVASWISP